MAMTFEQGLQAQLDSDDSLRQSAFGKRARRVLDLPLSNPRRKRVLARMEDHARVHIGYQGKDWSTVKAVDWKSIIELLIKLLPIILALFGV